MAPNKLNGPNFRTRDYATPDLGISRTAFWEAEATIPQDHPVHIEFLRAAKTVAIPANVAVRGEIVVVNNSSVAAVVTLGSASGGTQYGSVTAPANSTVTVAATLVGTVPRAAHNVFVASDAYPTQAQGGLHVVFNLRDYPAKPDATAIS